MRRRLALLAGLGLSIGLTNAAMAGPLLGTIVLTIAPNPIIEDGQGLGIPTAAVFSSGPVDLGSLPHGLALTGPSLGFVGGGLIGQDIETTFDLRIAFDGVSGSQSSIDVTGPLTGWAGEIPGYSADSQFQATPTLATVQGWTPNSGVPTALIEHYLNTSDYQLFQLVRGTFPPDTANFWLTVAPSAGASVPEPATILLYLAGLTVLGVRRGIRVGWS